jgi:isoprenylcysteine carboxyl methyltransferase (ICMT) family protein YpbQ
MPARIRKLIGGVGVVAFLIAYAVLMTVIADHLPDQWAVKLIFFVVAGVGWGLPLIPLITWMNRGK